MNGKLMKIVMTVVASLFIIITIYLMIGSGSSGDILKSYDAVKPDSTAGFSKTLQFVQSYTYATKDTSIAKALGISDEDAEAMANGTWNQGEDTSVTPTSGSGKQYNPGLTSADWANKLSTVKSNNSNCPYFGISDGTTTGYRITTINGIDYLNEVQNAPWFRHNPNDESTTGGKACGMYALANAAMMLNKNVYSINELIQYNVNSSGVANSCGKAVWTNIGNGSYDWVYGTINVTSPSVGLYKIPISSGQKSYAGINVVSVWEASMTSGAGLYNWLDSNATFEDEVYIVYAHKSGVLSSGNNHWLVIVGISDTGEIYFIGNGSRNAAVNLINDTASGTFTGVYRVTR